VTDDLSDTPYVKIDEQLLAKLPAGVFGTATARNFIWHSIIGKPFGDAVPSTNVCRSASGPSVDYQRLSKLTGGFIDEVCRTDYSAVLDNIAKGITHKSSCELKYPSAAEADPTKLDRADADEDAARRPHRDALAGQPRHGTRRRSGDTCHRRPKSTTQRRTCGRPPARFRSSARAIKRCCCAMAATDRRSFVVSLLR
jgi:hypothetical protein